jgi:flagellar biosynthesis protein FlhA
VSIRDLPSILEALSDAARANRETGSLVDAARLGLARGLCKQLSDSEGVLAVLTLEPGLEQILEASLHAGEKGPRLLLRPDLVGRILEAVGPLVEELSASGDNLVLVCSPAIRLPLRRLLEANYPQLSVLSYAEIVPGVQVRTRGMVQALDSNQNQA